MFGGNKFIKNVSYRTKMKFKMTQTKTLALMGTIQEIQSKLLEVVQSTNLSLCVTVILGTFMTFLHSAFTMYFLLKLLLLDLKNPKAITNGIWWFQLNFYIIVNCITNEILTFEGDKIVRLLSDRLNIEENRKNRELLLTTIKQLQAFPLKFSHGFFGFDYKFMYSVSIISEQKL